MSGLVSALKSKLASAEDYDKLIRSTSSSEITDWFQTKYSLVLAVGAPGYELALQRSISRDSRSSVAKVRSLSPPGLRKVLNALMREAEFEAISSLLKGIALGYEPATLVDTVSPVGEVDGEIIKRIAETRPLRRALETLPDHQLGQAVGESLNEVGTDSTLAIDLATQKVFTRTVWEAVKLHLSGSAGGGARRVLGQWFDLQNLLLVARSKILGVRQSIVQSFIIPIHYRLTAEELEQAMTASSLSSLLEKLSGTRYEVILKILSSETAVDTSALETAINRYFARECIVSFAGWRLSPGPPIAFTFLKQFESEDLQAILVGKMKGLLSEEIRRSIILHQDSQHHQ